MKYSAYLTPIFVLPLLLWSCGGDDVDPVPKELGPAPRVLSVSPAEGAIAVPITTRVWVVFSMPMDKTSAEAAFALETEAGDAVPGAFSWANENMVFTPTAMLAEEQMHQIRIETSAMNPDGQAIEDGVLRTFSTGTDVQVANVFPPNLAEGVGTDTSVELTFSNPMDAPSVAEAFEMKSDLGLVTGALSWDSDTVTFVPDETLANATTYSITVARRAKEVGGSSMRESFTSTFETLRTVPVVKGDLIAAIPTWTWTAPDDRTGFRYQLDGTDGEWTTVTATVTSYVPTSTLTDGAHTLYVQARYYEDAWSDSASWTTLIGPIHDGDLVIRGPDDLVDIVWLRVTGDLRVEGPNVVDLLGLESIVVVDGDVVVSDTRLLLAMEGLEGLRTIGGRLNLMFNDGLESLTGLGQLERIDGGLSVGMWGARSLVGLDSLEWIGGLSIFSVSLPDMSGLEQVQTIDGDLSCSRASLDPNGLDRLVTIAGDVRFDRCTVTSTTGFETLETIGGHLRIFEATIAFESFTGLTSIGGDLSLAMAFGATDMTGLSNLTSIGGNLAIQEASIRSFVGLESLEYLGGDLRLAMAGLVDFVGLSSLTTIDGDVALNGNYQLVTVDGLEALTSVAGDMSIRSNMGLTSLAGLSGLESLGENLQVTSNMSLATCEAEGLRDQLVDAGWTGTAEISGNGGTGTCD